MSTRAVLMSALAIGATLEGSAAAQTGDTGAAAPLSVEEIIVTARKRNESIMDVPVAVSALSSAQLERYAISSLGSIAQQTPQLVIGESANQVGGSINLRGIGAGLSNPSTEQSVTLNLDGVPVSYGNALRLGQYDLQRVEVLKGPQALFYGKNSPGGIVSLISKDPGREFEAQVRTGYEFEAQQRFIEGIVSGPLSDAVGGRLVAYYSKEDGWFRNTGRPVAGMTPGAAARSPNAEDIFVRGTLTFTSSDERLRVNLKANYGQRERDGVGPAWVAQLVRCPTGVGQNSGGTTTDCRLNRYYVDVAMRPEAAALHPDLKDGVPFMTTEQTLGSLSIDYDVSEVLTLSSVTGYYRLTDQAIGSFTYSNNPSVATTNNLYARSLSEELRLASDFDGPVNFVLGGFYQDADFSQAQPVAISLGVPFLSPFTRYYQDTRAYSLFGQLRFELTDTVELTGGGRWSNERKELSGTVNATPFEIARPKRDFDDFSPEVTLTYKPTPDLTAYAAYREGFTSGGFNTAPATLRSPAFPAAALLDVSFDQTTVKGGEVGLKGYLANRQVRYDIAAYYFDYSGLQLTKWDAAAFAQLTQNAGGADVSGAELNVVFQPAALAGLELHGSAAYNRAKYTDFIGGCYVGQSIAAGCNLIPRDASLDPSTFGTPANAYTSQDQSGQTLARAPKWTLNGGFSYEHDFHDRLGVSFAMDASYTSSYIYQTEASPEARQGSFWELNANLSLYGGPDRHWQLALIGRNLTNELVVVSGSAPPFTGSGTGTATTTPSDLLGAVNQPRSVLLQATFKY